MSRWAVLGAGPLGGLAAVLLLLLWPGLPPTALAAPASAATPVAPPDSCTACHQNLTGRLGAPAAGMAGDMHARPELRCAGCHGGDPAKPSMEAHDRSAGFIGVPTRQQIPRTCARCHADPGFMRRFNPSLPSDQLARYLTSEHGERLQQGDRNVATCTGCHGVHPVRAVTDSRSPVFATNVPAMCARCHADASLMRPYGIPTTQYADYLASVHGQGLLRRGNRQAPACNDCHGNHGAAPPGVASVANVCAQCHSATRDLFVRSPHKAVFDALQMPECTACHATHRIAFPTDTMIGQQQGAVCTQCHAAGSPGLETAGRLRAQLEDVKGAMAAAEEVLRRAANLGMDVGDARLDLDEANTQLIRARAVIHAANPQELQTVTAQGVAAAGRARASGEAAIAEWSFRRRGLGISAVVIVFVAVLLWLKLREIERTPREGT